MTLDWCGKTWILGARNLDFIACKQKRYRPACYLYADFTETVKHSAEAFEESVQPFV